MRNQPTTKPRFSRHLAMTVAHELMAALTPCCERICIAGSLRRNKQWVGDVELLYIPKLVTGPKVGDFFSHETRDLAEDRLQTLIEGGVLAMRPNALGNVSWGNLNKLALHTSSTVPVDLFKATPDNWYNYLVCRTGPAAVNVSISLRAQELGWKWDPYGVGFVRADGSDQHVVMSEEELFKFLNMPFLPPKDRA